MIFSKNKNKGMAYSKMAKWFNDVADSRFKSFDTISATFYSYYPEILIFFSIEARMLLLNGKALTEGNLFNVKLKAFRAILIGVVDIEFFFFRVAKIYA